MNFQKEDQLGHFFAQVLPGEQFSDQRQVADNRNPLLRQGVASIVEAAKHYDLLVLHPKVGFDAARGNHRHRIRGAAAGGNIFITDHVRHLRVNPQRHIVAVDHARLNFQRHADIFEFGAQ